jgi:D-tyrosyl-tRNA(Tyr) deacylase
MRAVVQRVKQAYVSIDDKQVAKIGKGFLVLLGIENDDDGLDADYIINKLLGFRVFEDEQGKMNLSIEDVKGEMLLVSQFTLLGDARKGRRPSFIKAARPERAIPLYDYLIEALKRSVPTQTAFFKRIWMLGL